MTFHQASVCRGRTCGPAGASYPLYIQSWTRFFEADWTEGLHGVAFDTSGIYHSADVATPAGAAVRPRRRRASRTGTIWTRRRRLDAAERARPELPADDGDGRPLRAQDRERRRGPRDARGT